MSYEIRCCCSPGLLLGMIELDFQLVVGRKVNFVIRGGEIVELEVGMIHRFHEELGPEKGEYKVYPALKSMDCPLEKLKQIPGFVEVNQIVK